MNIVVAPDSFKGSLTSIHASEIIKKAIKVVLPSSEVVLKPMADGGEGTLEALLRATKGERVPIVCTGPLGEKVNTSYAIVDGKKAIIECASIAGLIQVPEEKRNPDFTTSYGIGEVIIDALDKGCTDFVLGLGGSATNDGGLGMLQALGMKALDANGAEVGSYGKNLHHVKKISLSELDSRLAKVKIKVASDVDNPLCGERGATAVYGPQKGATDEQIKQYDQYLDDYSNLIEAEMKQSLKDIPGSGAAGGLGFAMLALGANLVSGAELLANTIKVEEAIQHAGLVITGEGQSDEQTLYGKAPGYIATLGKKHHVPVILLSGSLEGDLDILRERFSGCFSIVNKPLSLSECMENADKLLYEQTRQVIHLISSIQGG
ncbi:glycerate kinase [Virgibacillus profundi]|uniref:Glycerate kinase n=1 Tax=Virgibacillus profundi TaxID=2024555 RepID=A0A2A2IGN8_9BACI|nr:glycerate kinase [Virgibacillus profundi]PAV30919.1 glycerate kinase [Virgibacillus profundi]PXY55104.1 glycerate kinase [Virgibacillus profundi]